MVDATAYKVIIRQCEHLRLREKFSEGHFCSTMTLPKARAIKTWVEKVRMEAFEGPPRSMGPQFY